MFSAIQNVQWNLSVIKFCFHKVVALSKVEIYLWSLLLVSAVCILDFDKHVVFIVLRSLQVKISYAFAFLCLIFTCAIFLLCTDFLTSLLTSFSFCTWLALTDACYCLLFFCIMTAGVNNYRNVGWNFSHRTFMMFEKKNVAKNSLRLKHNLAKAKTFKTICMTSQCYILQMRLCLVDWLKWKKTSLS